MSDNLLAGPVDIVVIEFADPKPNGRVAPAIAELVNSGTIRILDLVFVVKDAEGDILTLELSDLDPDVAASFDDLEGESGGLLSDEDVLQAAEALEPGTAALLAIFENSWARKVVSAVVDAGGRVVAHDRLDAETVNAALLSITD